MKSFSDLSLSALLKSNLKKHGFTEPTPVQALHRAGAGRARLVPRANRNRENTRVRSATDPIAGQEPHRAGIRAMILSPTRELAIQIAEAFGQMAAGSGIRAAVVVRRARRRPQLQAIRKGAQVVIATPAALRLSHRELVNLAGVRILVLDEADRHARYGLPADHQADHGGTPRTARLCFFRHHPNPRQTPGRDASPQRPAHRGRFHYQADRAGRPARL